MDIDTSGRITRFLDSKAPVEPAGEVRKLMFTGVQILEPRIFDHMREHAGGRKFSTTRDTYPRMLAGGERLYGFPFDGFWQDLGTPGTHSRSGAANSQSGRSPAAFSIDWRAYPATSLPGFPPKACGE